MSRHPPPDSDGTTPSIVATGFTTAFLGDERLLREFVVGDDVMRTVMATGRHSLLYLFNDSYDPLRIRQLRIGVGKNDALLATFEKYCGRPIAEIPDPFDCHASYAEHFAQALATRLHALDIHPMLVDAHQAYRTGFYNAVIATTFANYARIQTMLATNFTHYNNRDLFRARCRRCLCIDATTITDVRGRDIRVACARCGADTLEGIEDMQGKLSWKLNCAARWNLYRIDSEVFAKSHASVLGTIAIAQFMSRTFYGGRMPRVVPYGDVTISRELSNTLTAILPPTLLKRLFTAHVCRDVVLNRLFSFPSG